MNGTILEFYKQQIVFQLSITPSSFHSQLVTTANLTVNVDTQRDHCCPIIMADLNAVTQLIGSVWRIEPKLGLSMKRAVECPYALMVTIQCEHLITMTLSFYEL